MKPGCPEGRLRPARQLNPAHYVATRFMLADFPSACTTAKNSAIAAIRPTRRAVTGPRPAQPPAAASAARPPPYGPAAAAASQAAQRRAAAAMARVERTEGPGRKGGVCVWCGAWPPASRCPPLAPALSCEAQGRHTHAPPPSLLCFVCRSPRVRNDYRIAGNNCRGLRK